MSAAKAALDDKNYMKKLKAVGMFARNTVRDYFENGNNVGRRTRR